MTRRSVLRYLRIAAFKAPVPFDLTNTKAKGEQFKQFITNEFTELFKNNEFEKGDYEGCLSVLNADDIDADYFRIREKLHEQELAAACVKQALKQVVPTFRDPNEINSHAEETDEVKAANEVLV